LDLVKIGLDLFLVEGRHVRPIAFTVFSHIFVIGFLIIIHDSVKYGQFF